MNIDRLKSKKFIGLYILVALLIVASFVVYNVSTIDAEKENRYYGGYGTEKGENIVGEILGDNIIEQSFTCDEDFYGVALKFATYVSAKDGNTEFELYDTNGNLVFSSSINNADLKDNQFYDVEFGKSVPGGTYILRLYSDNEPDQAVTLWRTDTDAYDGDLIIAGNPVMGDLNLKIIGPGSGLISGYYWVLAVTIIVLTTAIYYLTFIQKAKIHYVVMFMVLLLGIISMFVITPNSVPDEIVHYQSSYRVADDMFGLGHSTANGNLLMMSDDASVVGLTGQNTTSLNYSTIMSTILSNDNNAQLVETAGADASGNAFLGYIFSGLGIAFFRSIGASPIMIYFGARIFNLLFYTFIITLAIRKIPFGKILLATLAMLPMMIQEAASVSYDCVINGLALFFIAYCLYIAFSKEKPRWWDWTLMLASMVILSLTKAVYLPLAGIFFLIPTSKYGSLKRRLIVYAIVIVSVVLLFIKIFGSRIMGGGELEYMGTTTYSLSYFASNPSDAVHLLINTLNTNFEFFFTNAFASYFGWLEVVTPLYFSLAFLIIVIFSMACNQNDDITLQGYKVGGRIWTLILAVVSSVLVYAALMVSWTTSGSTIIEGIQGRYFLPIIPLFFLALYPKSSFITFKKDISRYLLFIELLIGILTFLYVYCYACL